MYLKRLILQNFRSYSKSEFDFSKDTTIIIGPNTAGKTNIIEAIFLLSRGKSFRADREMQMIRFGEEMARVSGLVDEVKLEVIVTTGQVNGVQTPFKRYLVNGVAKRRVDFASHLKVVLFSPVDLEIIVASPGIRREFMDDVLEQVDREYSLALVSYTKAIRQRNALLEKAREEGIKNEKQFEYWDKLLIDNGQLITKKREEFLTFVNNAKKDIFDFVVFYDKSIISKERLLQYKEAELGAAVTLVGPHRDDFNIKMHENKSSSMDVKSFGSRGQQRLVVLQLKLLELNYIEEKLGQRPLLLLDDIFSELDAAHIKHVLELIPKQQTILTTTHEEFVDKRHLKEASVVKLG